MTSKHTAFEAEVKSILQHGHNAHDYGRLWRQGTEQHNPNSQDAKFAAVDMGASLGQIRTWFDRLPQNKWEMLCSASPDLAAALTQLLEAVAGAQSVARRGWIDELKPHSWECLDRLQNAVQSVEAALNRDRELSGCRRDCLEVILRTGYRLHTNDVLKALQTANKNHGKSTIKHALASLVADGRLTTTKGAKSIGYGPPEWPPERQRKV
jgi:hypothetical protein